MSFASAWWEFEHQKSKWEDCLIDLLADGQDFTETSTDSYDCSLEIHGATDGWILSKDQENFIIESGFLRCFLNYSDGTEKHYLFKSVN